MRHRTPVFQGRSGALHPVAHYAFRLALYAILLGPLLALLLYALSTRWFFPQLLPADREITPETLIAHGYVSGKNRRVKVLGDGSLSKAFTIKAHGFSAKAKEKIEAAGGKAELITVHA